MRSRRLGVLGFALVVACGEELETATLVGWLHLPDCHSSVTSYRLDARYLTLEYLENQAIIRMQTSGVDFARVDGLHLHLRDFATAQAELGVARPVGLSEDVRAGIGLFETCPGSNAPLHLSGSITLDTLGKSKGDEVEASSLVLDLIDGRTGQQVGHLEGAFDFTVRRGSPYRRFAGP